ncbi:MAG: TIGR03016 family PEP-CTERM system-associated outer membrane protein [Burkholderiales bacterium]|nr:TIGR03016 family PEP-CTERM system-associated outer membrane protein [Burkholderiales bacterium]
MNFPSRTWRARASSLAVLLWLAVSGAAAQEASSAAGAGGRAFSVTPTLGANLTLTNNVNLTATDKQSDLILGLYPGIQVVAQGARVRGYLYYTLGAYLYANQQEDSNFYNTLSAAANAELWEKRLFLDVNASISQQIIDPFGTQSSDPSLNNDNRTEVTTVSVAPYLKGQMAGQVDYLARALYAYTDSGTSSASDSTSYGGVLSFNGSTRWQRLGWGLTTSYRSIDFSEGRREYDQLSWLTLRYAVTPELQANLRGNYERSNVTSLNGSTNGGFGGGIQWTPSPRTRLVLEADQRVFGSSHLYLLEYRSPRTIWTFSSVQGLSNGQDSFGQGLLGQSIPGVSSQTAPSPSFDPTAGPTGQGVTAFELLFKQFASVQPDPVLRAQLVNNFLKANNIDPNSTLSTNFLPDQVTEQLEQRISVAWIGIRSNVILNAYQTQARDIGPLSSPGTGLANGSTLRWYGGSASWSHRLTPAATLSVSFSGERTAEDDGSQSSTLWVGTVTWSQRVFENATLSIAARRQVFDSNTSPYNESALLAFLGMQF